MNGIDVLDECDEMEPRNEPDRPRVPCKPPRIVVAEDEIELRRLLVGALRKDGYEVVEASNGVRLLDLLDTALLCDVKFDLDLIISDIRMPGLTGLEVLAGLQKYDGAPPVILITAFGDRKTHLEAMRLGAVAVFDKPFDLDEFRAFVRGVVPPVEPREQDA